jgi:protein lysine acetyltransferase
MRLRHSDCRLAELPLFKDGARSELQRARRMLTLVTVGSGEVLIRQGTIGREVLIVADGLVSVTRTDDDECRVLGVVTAGDVLGEMSLLYQAPRSATVTTLASTTVYVATPREFFSLMYAVPSAAERIVDGASQRRLANIAA